MSIHVYSTVHVRIIHTGYVTALQVIINRDCYKYSSTHLYVSFTQNVQDLQVLAYVGFKMSSLKEQILRVTSSVTVELAYFLFMVAVNFQYTTYNALWYEKNCMNLFEDEVLCASLGQNGTEDEEVEVQQVSSY